MKIKISFRTNQLSSYFLSLYGILYGILYRIYFISPKIKYFYFLFLYGIPYGILYGIWIKKNIFRQKSSTLIILFLYVYTVYFIRYIWYIKLKNIYFSSNVKYFYFYFIRYIIRYTIRYETSKLFSVKHYPKRLNQYFYLCAFYNPEQSIICAT